MKLTLDRALAAELAELFRSMEAAYDQVAVQLGHGCDGCPDNCCDSYFTHHTYIEWAYLWEGLAALPSDLREMIVERAHQCELLYQEALAQGTRPQVMCPLNDDGRCLVYGHRLMVCRTHGVPAQMTRPDGKIIRFPGCFRCAERVRQWPEHKTLPVMERTALLRRLVLLEQRFLQGQRAQVARLNMTIARMLTAGPPVRGILLSDHSREP
ncbi:hypothetical protein [Desulfofustis limnaeus]|jgi:hypothetical protein|uniref:YkgJ family cysteine cluster protein n=1 Tax=Desulfofustis limnaeus TaxID=2740163 RepID=A0ABN6M8A9_9BACT|nr:hypothetical protein [Desulfofustis limnaeus]MDX9896328.1 hypothetical protein [Desulfofustis sp.]BDD89071.1 hypothetical protein DPPLL_34360 [Desulfofustis limnaeus]